MTSRARKREDPTLKICVVGDSHVACLKKAWDEISAGHKGVAFTFFAARGNKLGGLRVENGALFTSNPSVARYLSWTSGGKEKIVVQEYDVFLVYGLSLFLPQLDRRLSAAVQRHACEGALTGSANFSVARNLTSVARKPVIVGHTPQVAREAAPPSAPCFDYDYVFGLMSGFALKEGLQLFPQPRSTLADGWNTKAAYARDSIRLDVGDNSSDSPHPEYNVGHMNEEFGRLYLDPFVAECRQLAR